MDYGRRDFPPDRRPDLDRLAGPPPQPLPAGPPPGPALKSAVLVAPAEPPVDREKVCPLLLRVFTKLGSHHHLEDFGKRGQEPKDEVQMYTWMDATLRELCDLVKEVQPAARRPSARLSFSFVYPDRRGRNVMRNVGQVHSTRYGEDDTKSLRQLQFQTGDFLSVAIY
ncbi:hypothetical protein N2152v2_000190 [Parachlorella kessleri]